MILVDEKSQLMNGAPPPYEVFQSPDEDLQPPPFSITIRPPPTLDTLDPHLLLQIVNRLFPQTPDAVKGKVERQRETLYYLGTSLRLVNRAFYIGRWLLILANTSQSKKLTEN